MTTPKTSPVQFKAPPENPAALQTAPQNTAELSAPTTAIPKSTQKEKSNQKSPLPSSHSNEPDVTGWKRGNRPALIFLLISLTIGAGLRLIWGNDIEYKGDEHWMFLASQNKGFWEALFSNGMTSGVFLPNPGMSVALFVALAKVFHATTPPELARAVQICNIAALALLAWFSVKRVNASEKASWIWATGLVCVSPLAVLFHRKIWTCSAFPLFCMLFILAWQQSFAPRFRKTGAFFWGLLGVMMGQIHMPAFFFAAAIFLGSLIASYLPPRTEKDQVDSGRDLLPQPSPLASIRKFDLRMWLFGSFLGGIPLVPWLLHLVTEFSQSAQTSGTLSHAHFFSQNNAWLYWITDALGVGLSSSLHKKAFLAFLALPEIGGHSLYLVGLLHLLLCAVGGMILLLGLRDFWSARKGPLWRFLGQKLLAPHASPHSTLPLQKHAFLGLGLLYHLAGIRVHRHYLLMTFPLEWVWLSRLALARKRATLWLSLLWVSQLIITIGFLVFIHIHHGAPTGDYGTTYEHQLNLSQKNALPKENRE